MQSVKSSFPGGLAAAVLVGLMPSAGALGQVFTWSNGAGGSWNTGTNWSPLGVPDNAGESALINLPGGFTITVTGGPSPDSVQLLSVGAMIDIANNASLNIGGAAGIVNNGLVRVNATAGGNFTELRFTVPSVLSGTGTVRLNAAAFNLNTAYIETTGTGVMQHQLPHVIAGTGRLPARIENASTIVADVAGATLEVAGPLMQTGAGNLRADPGILSLGAGAEVSGGSINGANGGTWSVNSSPSISGITSNLAGTVLNNSTLRILAGGLTNNALLHVNTGAGVNFTRIRVEESCTLGGNGSVNLRSIDNLDTAYIESSGAGVVLTQSATHSITGSGRIYAPMINAGAVRATIAGRPLEIRSVVTHQGLGHIAGDNADAALGSGATILGGVLKTNGTGRVRVTGEAVVAGVSNLGLLSVDNNTILRFATVGASSGVSNDGTILVNSTAGVNFTRIRVDNACAVSGFGSINLNAGANLDTAYIESAAPGAILSQSQTHTIRGTGRIYAAILNGGAIRADVSGKVLEVRGEISQIVGGRIEGNPGIAGIGAGAIIHNGAFTSGSGGVVRSTGGCSIDGVVNTGTFHIANNTRVGLLAGGMINNSTISINDGAGVNFTTLAADAPALLSGNGMLTLRANGNPDTAFIDGLANGFTNGEFHTITGNGRLYGKLVNQGRIWGSNAAGEIVRIRGELTQTATGSLKGGVGAVALEGGSVTGGSFESGSGPVRVLSGTSSATSVTNNGQLQIDNNGRLTATDFVNNGTVTINDGVGVNFTSLTFPGVQTLGGMGEIVLRAGGSLDQAYIELTGSGSKLTIGQGQMIRGTGRFYGEVESKAKLSPGLTTGAIGRVDFRSPTTLASESRVFLDIAGDLAGQFDVITGGASLELNGSLTINIGAWTPSGDCSQFDLVTAPSITGSFENVQLNGPAAPGGRVWRLDYEPTRVSLRLTCPSDLTGDCTVDDSDFSRFVLAYNILDCADPTMPAGCPSDLNGDEIVDDADFSIWVVAYNEFVCE